MISSLIFNELKGTGKSERYIVTETIRCFQNPTIANVAPITSGYVDAPKLFYTYSLLLFLVVVYKCMHRHYY